MEKNTVVGAGLVGSLLSIYLANRGAKVNVYERRPDMRKANISAGKSINLALSDRGLKALRGVGIEQDIIDISIPMYGRMVHDVKGNTNFQPYGKEGQSILSVSRGELNRKLMSLAESHPNVTLHFNQRCTAVDIDAAKTTFIDDTSGIETIAHADRIYGTDGAFSAVRARMQFIDRFNYSQQYLEHGYKELTIPPAEDGGFRMDKNCLHIWPRGNYMLIALPNLDGSFTCTLFFHLKASVHSHRSPHLCRLRNSSTRCFQMQCRICQHWSKITSPTLHLRWLLSVALHGIIKIRCASWAMRPTL
jgi:kynurenine 3-monooxygenase